MNTHVTNHQSIISMPHSQPMQPVRIPSTWGRLVRRLMGLQEGRYQITLTVGEKPDWSVLPLGKIEQ